MKPNFLLALAIIVLSVAVLEARPPQATAAKPTPTAWLTSQKVADGVWCISDNGSDNMYVVEGKEKALLIDTGLGTAKLAEFVKRLTSKPLLVVNTHGHPDHAAGNYQFPTVYVHQADLEAAKSMASAASRARAIQSAQGKTLPDVMTLEEAARYGNAELRPVKDGFVFDLGGRKLEVIEVPGHTAGEIVLLDSAHRQVFTGDNDNTLVWLFLPGGPPLEVYLGSLKKLQARSAEFTTIYPGHGSPEPASLVADQIKAVESILDGSCKSEPYKSFAGSSSLCKYGKASVAYDPNNLRVEKQAR